MAKKKKKVKAKRKRAEEKVDKDWVDNLLKLHELQGAVLRQLKRCVGKMGED